MLSKSSKCVACGYIQFATNDFLGYHIYKQSRNILEKLLSILQASQVSVWKGVSWVETSNSRVRRYNSKMASTNLYHMYQTWRTPGWPGYSELFESKNGSIHRSFGLRQWVYLVRYVLQRLKFGHRQQPYWRLDHLYSSQYFRDALPSVYRKWWYSGSFSVGKTHSTPGRVR